MSPFYNSRFVCFKMNKSESKQMSKSIVAYLEFVSSLVAEWFTLPHRRWVVSRDSCVVAFFISCLFYSHKMSLLLESTAAVGPFISPLLAQEAN